LVDEVHAAGKQGGIGRSMADAPEIDGLVIIAPLTKISQKLKAGEFARVRITGVDGHDLLGELA
ncbi:hypothetical protein ABTL60_19960, partial [Acinetobacter baumannii]